MTDFSAVPAKHLDARLKLLPAFVVFGLEKESTTKYNKTWAPAVEARAAGLPVITCIGYDAGTRDSCRQYKAEGKESPGFANRFPLIEWGWNRERCMHEIAAAGLPVPVKSACFHCPASKKPEIAWLRENVPEKFAKAL